MSFLLLESGGFLLLESGGKLILESGVTPPTPTPTVTTAAVGPMSATVFAKGGALVADEPPIASYPLVHFQAVEDAIAIVRFRMGMTAKASVVSSARARISARSSGDALAHVITNAEAAIRNKISSQPSAQIRARRDNGEAALLISFLNE